MRTTNRHSLPLVPLLQSYLARGLPSASDLASVPGLGPRWQAVAAASEGLLSEAFLDRAGPAEFTAELVRFYEACVTLPLHADVVRQRAGMIRHGLNHLVRCKDPVPTKLERCLAGGGAYHVGGLGPAFWSAVVQALDPQRHSAWLPGVVAGLNRLGLMPGAEPSQPGAVYAQLTDAYQQVRTIRPGLSAFHIDHFLSLVAELVGRDLGGRPPRVGEDLQALVRDGRVRMPLRRRIKERSAALAAARARLEAGLARQDGTELGAALAVADPVGHRRGRVSWSKHAEELTLWVGRLWESDRPDEMLQAFWRADPVPGAGLWLPAAVLHLRQPETFFPWDETSRQGFARLDDAADLGEPPWERYRLFNAGLGWICSRFRLHCHEVTPLLSAVVRHEAEPPDPTPSFGGFCADTFHFLGELAANNRREWMETQRDRYRFAVREPLVELCRALGERYVGPVLKEQYGWDLETTARNGKALTSVVKNDYGQSAPYQTELWITFYRRERGGRRADAQLFVRVTAAGLSCGVRLGREARETNRLFRKNLQQHAELLFQALTETGAADECLFCDNEDNDGATHVKNPGDLRAWALGRTLVASRFLPLDTPLLKTEELVGEVLMTFDRLVPVYACAVEADPVPVLERRAGLRAADGSPRGRFGEADFHRATYLNADWLRRARELLGLKRQLILQGVPGTGKTHVARSLARLITNGRDELVRLVQFHPSYSYEEFVEGIKVKSVEVNGRNEVTYPVEDGLLCALAAEAARSPAEPFVLIIDEINRGNLPRVFGELLYLLEYRDQAVGLPYSRRGFRLPPNLYLLGTMNAADRSVALIDQALRRRFSFLDMPPDAAVLSAWLQSHGPRSDDPDFAGVVVGLFERLNEQLRTDLSPHQQVGHSYFMVPDLDEERLRLVWENHVFPLICEYFSGQPQRVRGYDFGSMIQGKLPLKTPRRGETADPHL